MFTEPARFTEMEDALFNFADLAEKTKVKQKGLFSEPLDFNIIPEVNISSMDDLVLVSEQDYYLNKILRNKFEYLAKEPELFEATLRLTELYLTAITHSGPRAEKIKQFALSNLNLI